MQRVTHSVNLWHDKIANQQQKCIVCNTECLCGLFTSHSFMNIWHAGLLMSPCGLSLGRQILKPCCAGWCRVHGKSSWGPGLPSDQLHTPQCGTCGDKAHGAEHWGAPQSLVLCSTLWSACNWAGDPGTETPHPSTAYFHWNFGPKGCTWPSPWRFLWVPALRLGAVPQPIHRDSLCSQTQDLELLRFVERCSGVSLHWGIEISLPLLRSKKMANLVW